MTMQVIVLPAWVSLQKVREPHVDLRLYEEGKELQLRVRWSDLLKVLSHPL